MSQPIARIPSPDADAPLEQHPSPRQLALNLPAGQLLAAGPPPIGMNGANVGGGGGAEEDLPERGPRRAAPELRFASYLQRLEDAVGRTWITRVDRGAMALDPTGERYSREDRETLIAFALDREGWVRRPTLLRSCGVAYLDDAALAAVTQAGPFLNPPPAMFEAAQERKLLFSFTVLGVGSLSAPHLRFR